MSSFKIVDDILKKNTEFDKTILKLINYPHVNCLEEKDINFNKEIKKLYDELEKNSANFKELKKKNEDVTTSYNQYQKLQLQQHYLDYMLNYYSGNKKGADKSSVEFFKCLGYTGSKKLEDLNEKKDIIDEYFKNDNKFDININTTGYNNDNLNIFFNKYFYNQNSKIYALEKVLAFNSAKPATTKAAADAKAATDAKAAVDAANRISDEKFKNDTKADYIVFNCHMITTYHNDYNFQPIIENLKNAEKKNSAITKYKNELIHTITKSMMDHVVSFHTFIGCDSLSKIFELCDVTPTTIINESERETELNEGLVELLEDSKSAELLAEESDSIPSRSESENNNE
mgnify:CR=1 FL=1|jgi:hypothetical protein